MLKLKVRYSRSYGKEYFWPMNDDAKFICETLMGRKSFTPKQIELMKKRKWVIEEVLTSHIDKLHGTSAE